MPNIWYMVTAAVLCAGIARDATTADARILRAALLLTLLADSLFASVADPLYGLLAFCAVQLVYCLRYGGRRLCGALLAGWAAALPTSLLLSLELLFAAAALYAIAFICSLTAAFAIKNSHPNGMRVVWGMSLFALCDILVGINYLLPGSAYPMMWMFYLPGQALLAFSGVRANTDDMETTGF